MSRLLTAIAALLALATVAGARANYANLTKCLNRSWPALIAA